MKPKFERNPIKKKITQGDPVIGIYVAIPSPVIVELAGYAGFDFVRIDYSHALMDKITIDNVIRAAENSGTVPMFRVNNEPFLIQSVLEAGAQGIIVPDVDSPEAAKSIVDAVRVQPLGERGMFGFSRSAGYGYLSGSEYSNWTNEEVLLGIQIESKEAADNLESILNYAADGIDIILSGRGDLAASLNIPGQKSHSSVLELEEKIFNTAKRFGKIVSVNLDHSSINFAEQVDHWKNKGVLMITAGHDINVIKHGFESITKAFCSK